MNWLTKVSTNVPFRDMKTHITQAIVNLVPGEWELLSHELLTNHDEFVTWMFVYNGNVNKKDDMEYVADVRFIKKTSHETPLVYESTTGNPFMAFKLYVYKQKGDAWVSIHTEEYLDTPYEVAVALKEAIEQDKNWDEGEDFEPEIDPFSPQYSVSPVVAPVMASSTGPRVISYMGGLLSLHDAMGQRIDIYANPSQVKEFERRIYSPKKRDIVDPVSWIKSVGELL